MIVVLSVQKIGESINSNHSFDFTPSTHTAEVQINYKLVDSWVVIKFFVDFIHQSLDTLWFSFYSNGRKICIIYHVHFLIKTSTKALFTIANMYEVN